ncbi:MAG: hypothetical protein EXS03_07010 [Phycisphaerales bacterium]|nr:hypothetical protein [Phycisphaerales bacterium]
MTPALLTCAYYVLTAATISLLASDAPALAPQAVGAASNKGVAIDVPAARRDFFDANPAADFFERGGRITRVFGRAFSTGRNPSESATGFIRDHADVFGVKATDLALFGAFPDAIHSVDLLWDEVNETYKFTLLGYSQVVNGIPVFRSSLKLLMRNESGYPMVLASSELRDLGSFAAAGRPTLGDFDRAAWSSQALRNLAEEATDAQLVIFAGVDDSPATPKLAVSFIVIRGVPGSGLSKMLYVVDAATGKVLFEEEQVCNVDITGTVQGYATTAWAADACNPEVPIGLPYATVSYPGGSVTASSTGAFTVPNAGTGSLALTSNLADAGKYFKVTNSAGSASTLTDTVASGATTTFMHNAANSAEQERSQVNAYLHANVARDFIIAANPNYPTISTQQNATAFQINVNLASTCNAYYNGTSINFYLAGGGCNNTAFSTVVHHEYGHHMVATGGSGQGAYGEGMGDVIGVLISETAVLGVGFQSCSTGIRNAANSCQYDSAGCSSCGSEIHACGQLLSGCVWSTRTGLISSEPVNYRTIIRNLSLNSVLLHGGTTIAGDITIDFLTLDDNNADINDGTPHYPEISSGFTAHGLPGPVISPIKFNFPSGLPTTGTPYGTVSLSVQVAPLGGQPQPNTGRIYWRTGTAAFQSAAMTQTTANNYTTVLTLGACGTSVDYYFEAKTTTNLVVTSPSTAPTAFHSVASGYGEVTTVDDKLETATLWTVGATGDAATTGVWTRVDPNGTLAQPENDHSDPGTMCFVTGQGTAGGSLGESDIDGGATTLTSPSFNGTAVGNATLSYWRWYSNDTGASPNADSMPVQISNNGGTTWVQLESVSANTNAWIFKSFRIADFVTPTATMKVRFVASDLGSGSVVEAGVDDLKVAGFNCTAPYEPADVNQDGVVDGLDLGMVLSAWGTPGGDINGSGTTDGADLTVLFSAWSG